MMSLHVAKTNDISIHAAREGGDATGKYRLPAVHGFQSTPPVKAATDTLSLSAARVRFQSTPPVKAATSRHGVPANFDDISIHAAREGGDAAVVGHRFAATDFNPRRP